MSTSHLFPLSITVIIFLSQSLGLKKEPNEDTEVRPSLSAFGVSAPAPPRTSFSLLMSPCSFKNFNCCCLWIACRSANEILAVWYKEEKELVIYKKGGGWSYSLTPLTAETTESVSPVFFSSS